MQDCYSGFPNMIPVEALPLPGVASDEETGGPVIAHRQVMRIASATMLREERLRMAKRAPIAPPAKILAILGEPDSGAPALPGAERETAWLRRTFRGVRVRRAGADPVTGGGYFDANDCDILHLASHVRVDDRHPWRSGLSTLRAHEIASMNLRARLAVLAGKLCRAKQWAATSRISSRFKSWEADFGRAMGWIVTRCAP